MPESGFEVAVSAQVLEHVADVDAAIAEMRRVVRPGGRISFLDTDWDSIAWHSPDRALMNRVPEAWEEHVPDPHLPRTLTRSLRGPGFAVAPPRVILLVNVEYSKETYRNRMIDLIAAFVAGRRGVTAGDADAWARGLRERGAAGD